MPGNDRFVHFIICSVILLGCFLRFWLVILNTIDFRVTSKYLSYFHASYFSFHYLLSLINLYCLKKMGLGCGSI